MVRPFAAPADPVHLAGPNILGAKRVVRVETFDVFWTTEYMIARSAANAYSIKSFKSLKQLSIWEPPLNTLLDGVFECGARALFLQQPDIEDRKSLVTLNISPQGAIKPEKDRTKIDDVGAVESGQRQCLVSTVTLNDLNVSVVDRLILLRDLPRASIALAPLMFVSSRFSLSKQAEYAISFQSNALRQRPGGRIVILSIGG